VVRDSDSALPSSTVVLVRPADPLPEILMVKRHARTSFGSAYAFPGGVVEDQDRVVDEGRAGLGAAEANRVLGVGRGGLAYYSAAVRELFEEAGVLLGTPRRNPRGLDAARSALNAGKLNWKTFLADHDVELGCRELGYIGFWITPEGSPRRYSTRFFLGRLPGGQVARHCGGEITDARWMHARDVLSARSEKRMKLIYPTRKTLETLATFDSVDAMLGWAQDCSRTGRVVCDVPTPVGVTET
jgi:8-oxo-dGTP pyrophosphatase MutT (NUDIX family)